VAEPLVAIIGNLEDKRKEIFTFFEEFFKINLDKQGTGVIIDKNAPLGNLASSYPTGL
jgi:hypothetical protein